jgi:hypothetical protein
MEFKTAIDFCLSVALEMPLAQPRPPKVVESKVQPIAPDHAAIKPVSAAAEILSSAFAAAMFAPPDWDDEPPCARVRAPPTTPRELIAAVCSGEFRAPAAPPPDSIWSAGFWRAFLPPRARHGAPGCVDLASAVNTAAGDDIVEDGFSSSPTPHAAAATALCEDLTHAVTAMRAAGWPPVFAFMLDEAWALVRHAFRAVAPVLGADCVLEPSLFAWALQRQAASGAGRSRAAAAHGAGGSDAAAAPVIGAAFTLPHRDYK